MELTLLLHPHTDPEGWRWAIHAARAETVAAAPSNFDHIVQAGYAPDKDTADRNGQTVLYATGRLLALLGIHHQMRWAHLDTDPLTGGN